MSLLRIVPAAITRARNTATGVLRWGKGFWQRNANRVGISGARKGHVTKHLFNEKVGKWFPWARDFIAIIATGLEALLVFTAFNFAVDTVAWAVKRVFGGIFGFDGDTPREIAFWVVAGGTVYLTFVAVRRLLK